MQTNEYILPSISNILVRQSTQQFLRSEQFFERQKNDFMAAEAGVSVMKDPIYGKIDEERKKEKQKKKLGGNTFTASFVNELRDASFKGLPETTSSTNLMTRSGRGSVSPLASKTRFPAGDEGGGGIVKTRAKQHDKLKSAMNAVKIGALLGNQGKTKKRGDSPGGVRNQKGTGNTMPPAEKRAVRDSNEATPETNSVSSQDGKETADTGASTVDSSQAPKMWNKASILVKEVGKQKAIEHKQVQSKKETERKTTPMFDVKKVKKAWFGRAGFKEMGQLLGTDTDEDASLRDEPVESRSEVGSDQDNKEDKEEESEETQEEEKKGSKVDEFAMRKMKMKMNFKRMSLVGNTSPLTTVGDGGESAVNLNTKPLNWMKDRVKDKMLVNKKSSVMGSVQAFQESSDDLSAGEHVLKGSTSDVMNVLLPMSALSGKDVSVLSKSNMNASVASVGNNFFKLVQLGAKVAKVGMHASPVKRNTTKTYNLSVECKNLRGTSLASDLTTRCVVALAEEYISRKGKFFWKIVGETEKVVSTSDPMWKTKVEVNYDPNQRQPIRFDVYGVDSFHKNRFGGVEEHLGAWIVDLKALVQAEDGITTGKLVSKSQETEDDDSHLQFDVIRLLRAMVTPKELFQAFYEADTDKSRTLELNEFRMAIRSLMKDRHQHVSREGEQLAFTMCDANGDGRLDYNEFVTVVYGRQGSISVLVEPGGVKMSTMEEMNQLYTRYKKDFIAVHRKGDEQEQEIVKKKTEEANAALRTKEQALAMLEAAEKHVIHRLADKHRAHMELPGHVRVQYDGAAPVEALAYQSKNLQSLQRRQIQDVESQRTSFIDQGGLKYFTTWSKHDKGMGVIVRSSQDTQRGAHEQIATCNKLNEWAASCGVRTTDPLPSKGVTYFEVAITRPEVQPGESLNGPYAVGLCTPALTKFDAEWLDEQPGNQKLDSVFLLACVKPQPYFSSWSMRWKAPLLAVGEGSKGMTVTYQGRNPIEGSVVNAVKKRRKKHVVVGEDYDDDGEVIEKAEKHEMASCRSDANLPRGSCYFEVTIECLGKSKGESLGGHCYIGLCTQQMQEAGWDKDWTRDPERKWQAWALNDNCAGQLSMTTPSISSSMSSRDVGKRLLEVFNSFDKDKTGLLEWKDLHQALRCLHILSTDSELREIFSTMGAQERGDRGTSLHYDEFVYMVRSRSSSGLLFHGEPSDWKLNSFFGAGDTIGVLVDGSKKCASFYKNDVFLGKAFSDLPDLLYPFVTLSRPSMSATLSTPAGKNMASRSEIMIGGVKKPWIDSSEFGNGDLLGFSVDMEERSVTLFKNGELIGRPFECIPEIVFPVVSLCHTGATASLSFPPQPNPKFLERIGMWLSTSTVREEVDVPDRGGVISLAGGVSKGGIELTVPRGDGSRRIIMRAADGSSVYDLEALGWGKACLVSPVVEVQQLHGPPFDDPAMIELSHCCATHDNLVLAFMPTSQTSSLNTHTGERRNVWKSLGNTVFTALTAKAPTYSSGFFCVLSLGEVREAMDMVHVECEFETGGADQGVMYSLATLPGHRVPKFGALRVGQKLLCKIKICSRSCVDPEYAGCKTVVSSKLKRGHVFLPLQTKAMLGTEAASNYGRPLVDPLLQPRRHEAGMVALSRASSVSPSEHLSPSISRTSSAATSMYSNTSMVSAFQYSYEPNGNSLYAHANKPSAHMRDHRRSLPGQAPSVQAPSVIGTPGKGGLRQLLSDSPSPTLERKSSSFDDDDSVLSGIFEANRPWHNEKRQRQHAHGNRKFRGAGDVNGHVQIQDEELLPFSDTAPFVMAGCFMRSCSKFSCAKDTNIKWTGRPITLDLELSAEELKPPQKFSGYLWQRRHETTGRKSEDWDHYLFSFDFATGELHRQPRERDMDGTQASNADSENDEDEDEEDRIMNRELMKRRTSIETIEQRITERRSSLIALQDRRDSILSEWERRESIERRESLVSATSRSSSAASEQDSTTSGATGAKHPRRVRSDGKARAPGGYSKHRRVSNLEHDGLAANVRSLLMSDAGSRGSGGLGNLHVVARMDNTIITKQEDLTSVVPHQFILTAVDENNGPESHHVIAASSREDRDSWVFHLQSWSGMRAGQMPKRQQSSVHVTVCTAPAWDAVEPDRAELAPFFISVLDHNIKRLASILSVPEVEEESANNDEYWTRRPSVVIGSDKNLASMRRGSFETDTKSHLSTLSSQGFMSMSRQSSEGRNYTSLSRRSSYEAEVSEQMELLRRRSSVGRDNKRSSFPSDDDPFQRQDSSSSISKGAKVAPNKILAKVMSKKGMVGFSTTPHPLGSRTPSIAESPTLEKLETPNDSVDA